MALVVAAEVEALEYLAKGQVALVKHFRVLADWVDLLAAMEHLELVTLRLQQYQATTVAGLVAAMAAVVVAAMVAMLAAVALLPT